MDDDELKEMIQREEERADHEKELLTHANLSASDLMPPTALELAHLAAALDPVGCNGGSLQVVERAITAAVSLYALSRFYLEENCSKSAQQLILSFKSQTALAQCWSETYYNKILPHNEELAKLKFYKKPISGEPDDVCKYFGVKDPRPVVRRMDALFRYWAERDPSQQKQIGPRVRLFWENRRRTDGQGREYFAFAEQELKYAKELQSEAFAERSNKGARKKKSEAAAPKK